MGSICSKGSYEKMSGKKGKKRNNEKPADLDKTMRDGIEYFLVNIVEVRPTKESHNSETSSHNPPDESVSKPVISKP